MKIESQRTPHPKQIRVTMTADTLVEAEALAELARTLSDYARLLPAPFRRTATPPMAVLRPPIISRLRHGNGRGRRTSADWSLVVAIGSIPIRS